MAYKKKSYFNKHLEVFYTPLIRLLVNVKPLFLIYAIYHSVKHPENILLHWSVAITVCFLMIVVGTDVGLHRYDAHRSFKTTHFKRLIILFFSIPCMSGSPLNWAVMHRKHHALCDTEEDPHSPNKIAWWKVWFYIKPSYTFDPVSNRKYYRGLVSDKTYQITHAYYFVILLLYILAIYFLFGPVWILYGLFLPSAIVDMQMSAVNVICHLYGYESYKSRKDCNSKNNWLVHALTFFSFGLHNNHHYDPGNHRTSKSKWEFDIPAWIIEVFFLDSEQRQKAKIKRERVVQ